MADKKISQLTETNISGDDDVFLVVQDGVSKKITKNNILSGTNSSLAMKADASTTTAALNLKADASTTTAALNLKADASTTTAALNLKADASTMTDALNLKADASTMTDALALKLNADQKGVTNGVASLDDNSLVPVNQLSNLAEHYITSTHFPVTGTTNKTYIALDTGVAWFWTGSEYRAHGWNIQGDRFIGPSGVEYAALPLDENGNAIAQINHRTGFLDSLIGIGGGAGEIAVATDQSALVVYDGVGGNVVYRPTDVLWSANASFTGSGVAAGTTYTPVTGINLYLNTPDVHDPLGLFDENTGEITRPTGSSYVSLMYSIVWPISTDGTLRRIRLEGYLGVADIWTPLGGGTHSVPLVDTTKITPQRGQFDCYMIPGITKIRVTLNHDGVDSMSLLTIQNWRFSFLR